MAINTTPNLHLPQWTPNEKPAYLTDFNQAFASIDTGFAGVQQGSAGAVQTATNAYNQATLALQTANQAQASINEMRADLEPSLINLNFTPGNDIKQMHVHLAYNMANAIIIIDITTNNTTSQSQLCTFTLPANITVMGLNGRTQLTNYMNAEPSIFLERLVMFTSDNKLVTLKTASDSPPPANWGYTISVPLIAKYPTTRSADGIMEFFAV